MWSFLTVIFVYTASARFQKNVFEGTNPWGKYPGVRSDENGTLIPQCHMTPAYPPPEERKLMEFVIDLDEDATDRWNEPTAYFKDGIKTMLALVVSKFEHIAQYIDKDMDEYLALFPKDWGDEIRGIAATLDEDIADVFMYNIAYG